MRLKINTIYQKRKLMLNESGLFGLFNDAMMRDKNKISSIDMVPTNANQCHILYDGKHVYSGARFHAGDIIEICPTRMVSKTALYSRDVRDMVFEVEPETEYVIPLGYCQHYDITGPEHPQGNCEWSWNPENRTIVIRAVCTIPNGTLLILNIED